MKFQFNTNQLEVLRQTLDVTLKQVGLQGLYTVVELVQLLENPIKTEETQEGIFNYEMTEKQIESFNLVFDIAVKAVGLNGAASIIAMVEALRKPLPEETAEVVE